MCWYIDINISDLLCPQDSNFPWNQRVSFAKDIAAGMVSSGGSRKNLDWASNIYSDDSCNILDILWTDRFNWTDYFERMKEMKERKTRKKAAVQQNNNVGFTDIVL